MGKATLRIVITIMVLGFLTVAVAPTFAAGANADVKAIQSALNKHGYHLKIDGKMGPQTEAALMKYQKNNGLAATGKADQATKSKLGIK